MSKEIDVPYPTRGEFTRNLGGVRCL